MKKNLLLTIYLKTITIIITSIKIQQILSVILPIKNSHQNFITIITNKKAISPA